jgi:hypothetical protein
MKLIKNYIISATLIGLVMMLSACNYQIVPIPAAEPKVVEAKPPFHGDYEVLRLRAMWAVCAQSYHQKVPTAGPNYVANICDCYVDRIRANYSQKELVSITKPQAEQMGMKYIGECNAEFMDRIGRQQGKGQGTNGFPKIEIPESKFEI